MPSILVVDDEARIRSSLAAALGREGWSVEQAGGLVEARRALREAFDAVLLDVRLTDGNGLDLLAEIARDSPETTVVMMSGQGTIEIAVKATRLGAFDFLEKPVDLERLLVLLGNATRRRALEAENRRLRERWSGAILGNSPAQRKLLEEIRKAAPTSARVLIRGESGTGKELVARALHEAGARRTAAFVAVNCAAIPEELIESELFGHEKGAFSGAVQARRGRFEEADGGTLFLDEVGDLSPRAQTKLLRALEQGEITRVGGSRTIRVDPRVVAATHRDLEAAVAEGAFREDLYFRLAVIPITVAPLRERREDIPALITHFAARLAHELGGRPRTFTLAALERLSRHSFPGNVRELRNLVERLAIMTAAGTIDVADVAAVLPAVTAPASEPARLADAVHEFERNRIRAALAAEDGNVTRAAQRLGLERSHLYKKMKQLGMGEPEAES